MSYKLFSPRAVESAHRDLWTNRSVQTELDLISGRTLEDDLDQLLPKRARVLEAGCGLGGWVRWLQDAGHDSYGVDFEEEIVARVNQSDPSLQVTVGDVTQLNFPERHFDAYMSLGVIEHFEEGPHAALAEAYRVLRPGGLAFVTVPFLNAFRKSLSHPMRDLYFAIRRLRGGTATFWEYRYTAGEMKAFMTTAGFEIVRVNVDDYKVDCDDRHMGLAADFFFLRRPGGSGYELNFAGRLLHRATRRLLSPRATSSGVLVVGRRPVAS
jgi:ubiquinone/menaquinone biosynthesis C-methylase UbiE